MRDFYFPGIADELFIRGKVPMTKQEVRAVMLAKLQIQKDSRVLDIGAGTGSVSIECALMAPDGQAYAAERDAEAIGLLRGNMERFGVSNITICAGEAPQSVAHLEALDRVFIGGSGGNLEELIGFAHRRLRPGGQLCASFILLENLTEGLAQAKQYGFEAIEAVWVAVSTRRELAGKSFFKPANPVCILSASKKE